MRRFLTETHAGNWVVAAAFYPLGLIWWTPITDLLWTVGGTLVVDGLLEIKKRKLR